MLSPLQRKVSLPKVKIGAVFTSMVADAGVAHWPVAGVNV